MLIVIQSEHRLRFYLEVKKKQAKMGKSYLKMSVYYASGSVDIVINLLKGKNSTKQSPISLQQAKEPYTHTKHSNIPHSVVEAGTVMIKPFCCFQG